MDLLPEQISAEHTGISKNAFTEVSKERHGTQFFTAV